MAPPSPDALTIAPMNDRGTLMMTQTLQERAAQTRRIIDTLVLSETDRGVLERYFAECTAAEHASVIRVRPIASKLTCVLQPAWRTDLISMMSA
jgi:hypothetical protein